MPAACSYALTALTGSTGECHFVTQRMVTQNGGVTYEQHQVCN
jgi:hypothetical protein